MYEKAALSLSRIYDAIIRKDISPSPELSNACRYLGKRPGLEKDIAKASIILSIISLFPAIIFALLFKAYWLLILPVAVNHFFSEHYKSRYCIMKIRDLGHLPDFFSMLISNLKINPNLENALINSCAFDYGKSTGIAKKIIKKISTGVDINAKEELQKEFRIFGELKVDLCINSLVSAISIKDKDRRNMIFSDSLQQLLDFMKSDAELFSRRIYSSVLMIFGLGTIIPLILVSIFPLVGIIGAGGSISIMDLFLFLIASLGIVWFIVEGLKKKSPSKFSQISVVVKPKGIHPLLLALLLLAFSLPSIIILLEKIFSFSIQSPLRQFMPFFFYFSATIILSANFYYKNRELFLEKKAVLEVEDSLIDSFMLIGSRLNEGRGIESSIKYALEMSKGKVRDFFSKIYSKITDYGSDLVSAFNYSIFSSKVFSKRIKSMSDLLCYTAKKHSLSAGESIIELCNYYRKIKGVEFERDNSLSKNTDMIKMTAMFFSPIVCALIINISGIINSFALDAADSMFFGFQAMDLEVLSFIITFYLFLMVVILSNFYSFLIHGDDCVDSEYLLSKNLIISLMTFTATLIISKLLIF